MTMSEGENVAVGAGVLPDLRPLPVSVESSRSGHGRRPIIVRTAQLAIIVIFLCAWEFLPKIPGISNHITWLDPFFISSPTRVWHELYDVFTGAGGVPKIWSPFFNTLSTSLIGTFVALIAGALFGIVVSTWRLVADISRPFLVVVNATPKVAIIPLVILLVKSDRSVAITVAFLSVFFVAFYNSAEGAGSVPREMIHNAQLLGASSIRVMLRVRSPYALAWTLAAMPNAIAFGLTATVTAEMLTGGEGLGYQLLLGTDNANATLLFSIVIIVSAVGVALVLGAAGLRRLVLPWWETSQGV